MKSETEERLLKRVMPYKVEYLYKYRSMESKGLENIFIKNEIYLSNPLEFNDPFDCKPRLVAYKSSFKREEFYITIIKKRNPNFTKGQAKKFLRTNPNYPKIIKHENIRKSFIIFLKAFGIYCLSEIPDNILMWSHYSDSHKGICLQFRSSIERTLFWESFKVTYQGNYPSVNYMDIGDSEQFFNLFATKSNHWEYEQERRIIKTPDEGGSTLYNFPSEFLTGVILGAKISKKNIELVKDWIAKYPSPITLYKAELNKRFYKLDIKGINC